MIHHSEPRSIIINQQLTPHLTLLDFIDTTTHPISDRTLLDSIPTHRTYPQRRPNHRFHLSSYAESDLVSARNLTLLHSIDSSHRTWLRQQPPRSNIVSSGVIKWVGASNQSWTGSFLQQLCWLYQHDSRSHQEILIRSIDPVSSACRLLIQLIDNSWHI